MLKTATITADGLYRYTLGRSWGDGRTVCFVMLNPSTADDKVDDATIRRCIAFAKKWGYDKLTVVNIWGYRTKSPKILLENKGDALGSGNDEAIVRAAMGADLVVAAWGNHGAWQSRSYRVKEMLKDAGVKLHYLELNKTGEPKHPLYVLGDTRPQPFA